MPVHAHVEANSPLSPSFLAIIKRVTLLYPTLHDTLFYVGQKAMMPSTHGLTSVKPWATICLLSLYINHLRYNISHRKSCNTKSLLPTSLLSYRTHPRESAHFLPLLYLSQEENHLQGPACTQEKCQSRSSCLLHTSSPHEFSQVNAKQENIFTLGLNCDDNYMTSV